MIVKKRPVAHFDTAGICRLRSGGLLKWGPEKLNIDFEFGKTHQQICKTLHPKQLAMPYDLKGRKVLITGASR